MTIEKYIFYVEENSFILLSHQTYRETKIGNKYARILFLLSEYIPDFYGNSGILRENGFICQ